MSRYKDKVFSILKDFDRKRNAIIKGWNDDNQKKFYQNHLDPIVNITDRYIKMLDEVYDMLARSESEIDSLVGLPTPFYSGTPHDRGDRVGGSYAVKDNIDLINTIYLSNNENQK